MLSDTRLTNAFSKKFENHAHMVAIYAVWYFASYARHGLGLSKTLMTWEDILAVMDAEAPKPGPRGPYKKTAARISN